MNLWNTQSIQFAWFLPNAENVDGAAFFERFWGSEPDTVQRNKIPSQNNPFLNHSTSQSDGMVRLIQVQPGRVDLVIAGDAGDADPHFASVGDLPIVLNDMVARFNASDGLDTPVLRQSIVVNSSRIADSYEDAAHDLYRSVGFDPNLGDVSDLMFQVNKRAACRHDPSILMNRLLRFSVTFSQMFSMDMAMAGTHPGSLTKITLAAGRQFDFNTVPDGRLFGFDTQQTILEDLSNEMLRICESGSIDSLREELSL